MKDVWYHSFYNELRSELREDYSDPRYALASPFWLYCYGTLLVVQLVLWWILVLVYATQCPSMDFAKWRYWLKVGNTFTTTSSVKSFVTTLRRNCAREWKQEVATAASSSLFKKSYKWFRCPEALFHSTLLGVEGFDSHENLYNAIIKRDMNIRKHLYATFYQVLLTV